MNWLRGIEIRRKLQEKKGKSSTSIQPSIGWLYTALDTLKRQGFVEEQEAQLTK